MPKCLNKNEKKHRELQDPYESTRTYYIVCGWYVTT